MGFVLDPRIQASSHPLLQLGLCDVRLQDDARFAWIVLVPRHDGLIELAGLTARERARVWHEAEAAGQAVRAVGEALGRPVAKLNHGQLGNVVAQLHLHVIGRREDDEAWPGPVWGHSTARPYEPAALIAATQAAKRVLEPLRG